MASLQCTNAQTGSIRHGNPIKETAGKPSALGAALLTFACAVVLAVGAANAAPGSANAQPKHEEQKSPPLQVLARHVKLRPSNSNDEQHFIVQCPIGHVPTRYSIVAAHDRDDFFVETGARLIDRRGVPLAPDNATLAYPVMDSGGYD